MAVRWASEIGSTTRNRSSRDTPRSEQLASSARGRPSSSVSIPHSKSSSGAMDCISAISRRRARSVSFRAASVSVTQHRGNLLRNRRQPRARARRASRHEAVLRCLAFQYRLIKRWRCARTASGDCLLQRLHAILTVVDRGVTFQSRFHARLPRSSPDQRGQLLSGTERGAADSIRRLRSLALSRSSCRRSRRC